MPILRLYRNCSLSVGVSLPIANLKIRPTVWSEIRIVVVQSVAVVVLVGVTDQASPAVCNIDLLTYSMYLGHVIIICIMWSPVTSPAH